MSRLIFLLTIGQIFLLAMSCRQAPSDKWIPDSDAVLNVCFFHLTDRCDACTAIETNTKKVLEEHFKDQVERGTIKFYSFNIDKKENKAIAEKYKISYTSLLLLRADGTYTDFTNTAMNYAFMNPEKYEELLKSEIRKNLE